MLLSQLRAGSRRLRYTHAPLILLIASIAVACFTATSTDLAWVCTPLDATGTRLIGFMPNLVQSTATTLGEFSPEASLASRVTAPTIFFPFITALLLDHFLGGELRSGALSLTKSRGAGMGTIVASRVLLTSLLLHAYFFLSSTFVFLASFPGNTAPDAAADMATRVITRIALIMLVNQSFILLCTTLTVATKGTRITLGIICAGVIVSMVIQMNLLVDGSTLSLPSHMGTWLQLCGAQVSGPIA